jgi:hypothetical protein
VFGYFVVSISAAVAILRIALPVAGSIAITHMDSENAAAIIAAMGKAFPHKGLRWRRK